MNRRFVVAQKPMGSRFIADSLQVSALPFEHAAFELTPPRGEIYPGGHCEITVVFRPGAPQSPRIICE